MINFNLNLMIIISTAILIEANPTLINNNRGAPLDPNLPPPRYIGSCRERNLCCSGRDSSCSIPVPASLNNNPKTINAGSSLIGNLIGAVSTGSNGGEVKECYCDSACITLGDCCMDYKETCGVQDCLVSEWNQWSECNTTCGIGTMQRSRYVIQQSKNGGKECPDLNQKRACHGQQCKIKDDEKMLRETAIILQSKFSATRNIDEDKDIRKNLRLNYPKDPLKENINEYCVLFEIDKIHKNCATFNDGNSNDGNGDSNLFKTKFKEGEKICVQCQDAAMRRHLGYRCYGHGINGKSTRWSLFNFNGCYGRWIRLNEQTIEKGQRRCQCKQFLTTGVNATAIQMDPDLIFV